MIVKCINSEGTKLLEEGKIYTVKSKWENHSQLVLTSISGFYHYERFIKLNDTKISFKEHITNYHHNLAIAILHGFDEKTIKHAKLKKTSKLKTLAKDVFYKVVYINNYGHYINVRLKNIFQLYSCQNFVFYTEEDYELLMRYKKMENIKNKLNIL